MSAPFVYPAPPIFPDFLRSQVVLEESFHRFPNLSLAVPGSALN
jgi:hypothetical protein